MTTFTLKRFISKCHLCWLFTASDVQVMTKEVQKSDKPLVPQGGQRNLWWHVSYIRWKIPLTRQLKAELLELRHDISALKIKTVQEGHLWSLCLKIWYRSQLFPGRSENFNQKDSGDVSGTCRFHHPWCFGHEEALCQIGAKMFECGSEAWSCCGFAGNSWAL